MPDLGLEVTSFRCDSCGYQWTHSHARIIPPSHPTTPGGTYTSTSSEPPRFLTIYSYPGPFTQPACIRCISSHLPPGWEEAQAERQRAATAQREAELAFASRPRIARSNPYKDKDLDDLLS